MKLFASSPFVVGGPVAFIIIADYVVEVCRNNNGKTAYILRTSTYYIQQEGGGVVSGTEFVGTALPCVRRYKKKCDSSIVCLYKYVGIIINLITQISTPSEVSLGISSPLSALLSP